MPRKYVKDDLLNIIGGKRGVPPILAPVALDAVAAADAGVSYRDYSNDGDAAFYVWDKCIETYDLDAALIFIDDFFEYEPLGVELTDERDIPKAARRYIRPSVEWLMSARAPSFDENRFPMRSGLVHKLKQKWGDNLLVGVSVAAPFTGVSLLCGIQETMLLVYDDEELLRQTIDFTTRLSVACAKYLALNGADVIWYGDCAASSGFIGKDVYDAFAFGPAKDAVSQIKETGVTVIYHAGENRTDALVKMAEIGADVLSCGEGCDMAALGEKTGCCLTGNVDPIGVLLNGRPETIESAVYDLRIKMRSRGKFIANTAEGIAVSTPRGNIAALFNALRREHI